MHSRGFGGPAAWGETIRHHRQPHHHTRPGQGGGHEAFQGAKDLGKHYAVVHLKRAKVPRGDVDCKIE